LGVSVESIQTTEGGLIFNFQTWSETWDFTPPNEQNASYSLWLMTWHGYVTSSKWSKSSWRNCANPFIRRIYTRSTGDHEVWHHQIKLRHAKLRLRQKEPVCWNHVAYLTIISYNKLQAFRLSKHYARSPSYVWGPYVYLFDLFETSANSRASRILRGATTTTRSTPFFVY
jgi:hypothetical protein